MSSSKLLSAFVFVLVVSLCLGIGFPAGAFAQVAKLTICHLPTKGDDELKTLTLPAADVAIETPVHLPQRLHGKVWGNKICSSWAVSGTFGGRICIAA